MSQIIIDIGAAPDDSLGTPLRQAFADINQMFSEVYLAGPAGSTIRVANNVISTTVINSNLVLNPNGIGKVQANNSVLPSIDDVYDLGSPTQRFNTVYIGTGGIDLDASITISGTLRADGNIIAGQNFIGNGALLTGITAASSTQINNGNTVVDIVQPNDPVTITVDGVGNVAVFDTTGVAVAGAIAATGNIAANYFVGNGTALLGVMADRGPEPSANWNNIEKMGIYTINRTSWTGTQNTPVDSQVFVGMLEVKNSTELAIVQTFWPGTVDTADVRLMWVRNYWDGEWTAWQRMINGSQTIDGGDQF